MSSDIAPTSSPARVDDSSCTNEEIHPSDLHPKEISFPPVFSLPSELLESIFIHLARDYYEHSNHRLLHDVPGWVNVSYVCRYWRNIALNNSTLWSYHFNLSLRWTQELMLRSRQVPLKVSWVDPHRTIPWWFGFQYNLMNHSRRIQELVLYVQNSHIPHILSFHSPILETLMVAANDGEPNKRLVITDAGEPVLRTVALRNCILRWDLLNMRKLESLSLVYFSPPDHFNFVRLLATLRSTQNLTILRITNAIPGGKYSVPRKIDLPHLDFLGVAAPLQTVIFFLSCVEVPSKTQINLTLWLENATTAEDYAPISSFIAQQFKTQQSPSSAPIIRSLGMFVDKYTALIFSSLANDRRTPSGDQCREFEAPIPLEIVFRNRIQASESVGGTPQLQRIAADICSSFPDLTDVETLYVRGNGSPCKFNYWREVLGCLDNLQSLIMEDCYMPDLSMLSLAAPKPEEGSDRQPADAQDPASGRTLVPALEKVELHGVRFLPDDVTEHHSGMSQQSLIDTLSTRIKFGGTDEENVIIQQCSVSEWP